MTPENVARKVRALRNTAAPGSGATDAERATAARLADKLERENRKPERRVPSSLFGGVTITFTAGGDFNVGDAVFVSGTNVTTGGF